MRRNRSVGRGSCRIAGFALLCLVVLTGLSGCGGEGGGTGGGSSLPAIVVNMVMLAHWRWGPHWAS